MNFEANNASVESALEGAESDPRMLAQIELNDAIAIGAIVRDMEQKYPEVNGEMTLEQFKKFLKEREAVNSAIMLGVDPSKAN